MLEAMREVHVYSWQRFGDHNNAQQAKTIAAFKAARLVNFRYVKHHQLLNEEIDLLQRSFPFVTAEIVQGLVAEKADYHVNASNVDAGCDLWEFWVDHKEDLPRWHGVAKKIALIQPSSAFMERAFSILRACMDERQASSFSDRVAAAALLKYNRGRGT